MCTGRMRDLGNDDEQRRWDETDRSEETVCELLSRNPDGLLRRRLQA
jgi:hypothetical protein